LRRAVLPILRAGARSYAMFEHFERYPWVLPKAEYRDEAHPLEIFDHSVLEAGRLEAAKARGRSRRR
jgi:hypothetical protein